VGSWGGYEIIDVSTRYFNEEIFLVEMEDSIVEKLIPQSIIDRAHIASLIKVRGPVRLDQDQTIALYNLVASIGRQLSKSGL
jgi:hypothetical protein